MTGVQTCALPIFSPLVATELSALLQRRVRAGELTSRYVNEARRRFQDEVASGAWRLVPFQAAAFSRASELLWTLGAPLATLDSMHLACALLGGAESLATADRQLATACGKAMLHVHTFR